MLFKEEKEKESSLSGRKRGAEDEDILNCLIPRTVKLVLKKLRVQVSSNATMSSSEPTGNLRQLRQQPSFRLRNQRLKLRKRLRIFQRELLKPLRQRKDKEGASQGSGPAQSKETQSQGSSLESEGPHFGKSKGKG